MIKSLHQSLSFSALVYQAKVHDINGYHKVQPIEILRVVTNLFETMIHVNLKGSLMNLNEVRDEKLN